MWSGKQDWHVWNYRIRKVFHFMNALTSIERIFILYSKSAFQGFDDDSNIRYLFFCTIARKNKTRIASVIEEVITDP
jgi:hypothetical protein